MKSLNERLLELEQRCEDLDARIRNLVREGSVTEVNYDTGLATVAVGEKNQTLPIPWAERRMGAGARTYCHPEPGEQVVMISPSGNLRDAVIIGSTPRDRYPVAGTRGQTVVKFGDGAVVGYDANAKTLTVNVQTGQLKITALGGVKILGNVQVTGTVTAECVVSGCG